MVRDGARSQGFCFVCFSSSEEAEKAVIEINRADTKTFVRHGARAAIARGGTQVCQMKIHANCFVSLRKLLGYRHWNRNVIFIK